ncbi:MAG: putative rRNA maturation factor [Miltoncostaeaceae bacterium]|nr:putative rRNA maturation factor [Miltoncostaeaceae bacterium]
MIEVEVQSELPEVETPPLVECLRRTAERLEIGEATIGLMVVGPERMRALNAEHRAIDKATDVLSFPLDGPDLADGWPEDGPPPELGDVIICPAAAEDPLETLVVHGLLHLLGYDHETDEGQMLALQDELLVEPAGP